MEKHAELFPAELCSACQSEQPKSDIPKHVLKSIVATMLPDIIAFFETEEGRREFEEWKVEREREKNSASKPATVEANTLN